VAERKELARFAMSKENELIVRENAVRRRREDLEMKFRPQAPNASDAALLTVAKASAVVQDSAFTYDSNASLSTIATLPTSLWCRNRLPRRTPT